MQAQKRKASKPVHSKKKASYFRQKAKSVSSISKTIKRELKTQKKAIAKSARQTIKPQSRKKMHSSPQVANAISKYFLSSDILRQGAQAVSYDTKREFEKQVEITQAQTLNTGLKGRQSRTRLNRMEVMRRNLMILVRRLLSWFSARSYSINLTVSGRRALAQLEDLYDLLILEAMDDESLLKLKVAYGEACYYVTQASRGYNLKHSGRGKENYSPYFDRFVESATG